MIRILTIFFLLQFTAEAATSDTTVVRNLNEDWYFVDNEGYLPLVDKTNYQKRTIHFTLKAKEYEGKSLLLKSSDQVSVFLNNDLALILNGAQVLSIDSLQDLYQSDLHFTVYNKNLNVFNLTTQVLSISAADSAPLGSDLVLIKQRRQSNFNYAVLVSLFVLAVFLATLYSFYANTFIEFFKLRRAIGVREIDENLLKNRPLNGVNLLFYLFLSLLIGLTIFFSANMSQIFQDVGMFRADTFLEGILNWIKISFLIFLWLTIKYLLIGNLTGLFKLGGFHNSHFINYVRMTIVIFSVGLVFLVFSYYGFGIVSTNYYIILFNIMLILMGIKIIILFFKLLNTGAYRTLHLFSYLCGTEVIPYILLLYLGLNQPF